MKILMLTPYLPFPPSSGGQIRSYNLIKHLSRKHEITLCSLIKYEEEKKYVEKLEKFCKKIYIFKRPTKPWTISNILRTGFSLYPFLVIRNYSSEEKRTLKQIVSKDNFDIIHAETFYVSPHIPQTDVPIVLVDQTIEYQVYQHYVDHYKFPILKPLLHIDVLKMKFWEEYYWRKAARVVAVSEKDALVMKKLVKNLKVDVVPNGVGEDLTEQVLLHFNKTILFIGNYLWLQNAEAARILAREVFPLVLKKVPDARLVIAGQNTEKIKHLMSDNVLIQDFAVDDIESVKKVYKESGILVAPLYGPGGTRLKILGAMSAKLPVVTTKIGNEGIDAKDNESILRGETPEELATCAVKLLKAKDFYKKIAENARKLVDEKYSYDAIAENLSKVYKEALND